MGITNKKFRRNHKVKRVTVDEDAWKQFDKHCLTKLAYSPSTLDDRKRKLRHLQNHGINLEDFDEDEFYEYLAKRITEGAKPSTLNHYVKAMNAWCHFKELDVHFDQYTEREKPVKIPTTSEVSIILKAFNRSKKGKLLKTVTYTLVHTGMRIGEICDLTFDQIDYQRKTITVTGKWDRTRTIPVKEYLLTGKNYPSIKNYIKHHRLNTDKKHVFTYVSGQLPEWYYRRELKKIGRYVGLPWIHPHSFRHYYGTVLLKKGVNLKVVQLIMGHANLKTTSRYLHMLENDIFAAINNINFDNLLFDQTEYDFQNWPTNPYGENKYGPGQIYNASMKNTSQPMPPETLWLTQEVSA